MTGADEYTRTMLTRSGTDRLPAHLAATYGIEVASLSELDLGVFQVNRTDGPAWVARVFPAARPAGAAAGDAAVLDFLAGAGFSAERRAAPQPVSVLDGQDVLVTGYVEAVPRSRRLETIRRLGGFIRLGAMTAWSWSTGPARGSGRGCGRWPSCSTPRARADRIWSVGSLMATPATCDPSQPNSTGWPR
jgi:hypothetical protein